MSEGHCAHRPVTVDLSGSVDRDLVTAAGERVDTFRYDVVRAELDPIRCQAARWAADHRDRLKAAIPEVPEALNDRARDLWRPLLAIADAAGGGWPERARRAAQQLSRDTLEPDFPATPPVATHSTPLEVAPMKTTDTIPAPTEALKTRTPGTVPGAKTKAKSTPTASTTTVPKQRAASRKTASTSKAAVASDARSRAGTKKALVLALLRRKQGAATAEIAKAAGWQHHTIRGFISGTVTKGMGLTVESSTNGDRGRTYRIF